jgi:hypothetical protein
MALFADLKGNANYMRIRESHLTTGLSDAQVSALYLDQARTDIRLDLNEMTGVSIDDTSKYNEFATEHEERLRTAFAVKQLWYLLNENFSVEGVNNVKYNEYGKEYQRIKSSFRGLTTTQGAAKVRVFRAQL